MSDIGRDIPPTEGGEGSAKKYFNPLKIKAANVVNPLTSEVIVTRRSAREGVTDTSTGAGERTTEAGERATEANIRAIGANIRAIKSSDKARASGATAGPSTGDDRSSQDVQGPSTDEERESARYEFREGHLKVQGKAESKAEASSASASGSVPEYTGSESLKSVLGETIEGTAEHPRKEGKGKGKAIEETTEIERKAREITEKMARKEERTEEEIIIIGERAKRRAKRRIERREAKDTLTLRDAREYVRRIIPEGETGKKLIDGIELKKSIFGKSVAAKEAVEKAAKEAALKAAKEAAAEEETATKLTKEAMEAAEVAKKATALEKMCGSTLNEPLKEAALKSAKEAALKAAKEATAESIKILCEKALKAAKEAATESIKVVAATELIKVAKAAITQTITQSAVLEAVYGKEQLEKLIEKIVEKAIKRAAAKIAKEVTKEVAVKIAEEREIIKTASKEVGIPEKEMTLDNAKAILREKLEVAEKAIKAVIDIGKERVNQLTGVEITPYKAILAIREIAVIKRIAEEKARRIAEEKAKKATIQEAIEILCDEEAFKKAGEEVAAKIIIGRIRVERIKNAAERDIVEIVEEEAKRRGESSEAARESAVTKGLVGEEVRIRIASEIAVEEAKRRGESSEAAAIKAEIRESIKIKAEKEITERNAEETEKRLKKVTEVMREILPQEVEITILNNAIEIMKRAIIRVEEEGMLERAREVERILERAREVEIVKMASKESGISEEEMTLNNAKTMFSKELEVVKEMDRNYSIEKLMDLTIQLTKITEQEITERYALDTLSEIMAAKIESEEKEAKKGKISKAAIMEAGEKAATERAIAILHPNRKISEITVENLGSTPEDIIDTGIQKGKDSHEIVKSLLALRKPDGVTTENIIETLTARTSEILRNRRKQGEADRDSMLQKVMRDEIVDLYNMSDEALATLEKYGDDPTDSGAHDRIYGGITKMITMAQTSYLLTRDSFRRKSSEMLEVSGRSTTGTEGEELVTRGRRAKRYSGETS